MWEDLQGERENGVIVFNLKNIEKNVKNEERAGRCPLLRTTAGSLEDWNSAEIFLVGRKYGHFELQFLCDEDK